MHERERQGEEGRGRVTNMVSDNRIIVDNTLLSK